MTGSPHHFPPPGAPLPEEPPGPGGPPPEAPAWGASAPPAPRLPVPGMLGAAHKPGAVPLRPLTLGNIYDGAFRIIRFNPKATVGAAVLVTAVAMLIPVVVSTVTAFTVGTGLGADGEVSDDAGTAEALGLLGSFGSLVLGIYAAQLGVIFVTGMVAHVTHAAAVGRRLTLAEAWAATYGKRWRLVGQAFLVGFAATFAILLLVAIVVVVAVVTEDVLVTVLLAIVLTLGSIPLLVWLWVKVVYLATPALMLEPIGVFGSFGRNWRLTAGQFWRTLGIGLLTLLMTGTAGYLLTLPVSVGGQIAGALVPEYVVLILVLTQAVSLVIQNAFVAPFTAAVTSLQYLDQRMRKEAYDVELMAEAGLIPR
ncbi:hypothetical protein [Nocardioides antri]|uniref:Glycerophosphoryl diester phosphodiesterase membrane domain-containing protein n=1 Tax=Nocardioides antri TaxID=2607659 RepID=A0A5B1LYB0_9ACTN|nr:hypothetical protein [Nocardioides antri]KAA1425955.1 hypothetical protein F0U47_16600 [Nocardioides antri]